jgi:hypothetical protein
MTLWELRQMIESNVPVSVFAAVIIGLIVLSVIFGRLK